MRIITSKTSRLLSLAAGLLMTLTANAQFSTKVEQYANTDHSQVLAKFSLTEVATQLGTDTATLVKALDEWSEAGPEGTTKMFQSKNSDGTFTGEYNGNFGEFWIGLDGDLHAYGAESAFFGGNKWDANEDLYGIYVGQYPEFLAEGAVIDHTFALVYGDKTATFDINYTVKKVPDMPEPTTVKLSELNVICEKSVDVTRLDNQGYEATQISFDLAGVAEQLGTADELLAPSLSKLMYTLDSNEFGTIKDSLTNAFTAGEPGWWYKRLLYADGDNVGEASNECCAGGWGDDAMFFVESISLDPATGLLTGNLGQYPGHMKADDTLYTSIYLIYGDKAVKLTVNLKCEAAPVESIEDMTNVGNTDITLKFNGSFADYQPVPFSIDIEAIAQALGCASNEITLKCLADEGAFYTGNPTANNGGYWLTDAGLVCNHGASAAMYFEPSTDGDYSLMNGGLYPGIQNNAGESYQAVLYFVNGKNYYTVTVTYTITERELVDQSGWEIVATRPAAVQIIPTESYIEEGNQTVFTLTPEKVNELIGTSVPAMYVLNNDEDFAATGEKWVPASRYECTPAPGAWVDENGIGTGWGSSAAVGICYDLSSGAFTIYQMPGTGKNVIGNTMTVPIYLVNDETHKLIEVKFNIQFVAELKTMEVVGEKTIMLPLSTEMEELSTAIDLSDAATALGLTIDELAESMVGQTASGLWSDPMNMETGLTFRLDGSCDPAGMSDLGIYIVQDTEGNYQAVTYTNQEIDDKDFKTTVQFGFCNGDKLFVYIVNLLNEAAYTGISNINAATTTDNKVYDLMGREVKKAVKGIYIMNNKKVIVK
ncbi:MAG: DUF4859 domain-containing protein [Prevotella sp.]